MRVEDQLFAHARTQPDKLAVIAGDKRLSYGAFAAAVASLAAALAQAGVGRGDRVLVFMENRAEAAIAIYGVLAAGAVFSPSPSLDLRQYDDALIVDD